MVINDPNKLLNAVGITIIIIATAITIAITIINLLLHSFASDQYEMT